MQLGAHMLGAYTCALSNRLPKSMLQCIMHRGMCALLGACVTHCTCMQVSHTCVCAFQSADMGEAGGPLQVYKGKVHIVSPPDQNCQLKK